MAVGAAVAATLIVAGSVMSAKAQREAGAADRARAEASAKLKREQADEMLRRTEINVKDMTLEGELLKSEQTAMYAKGGVDVTTGTALLMLEDTENIIATRQERMRYEAEYEALNLRKTAAAEEKYGVAMERAAKTRSTATLLGGFGQAAGMGASSYQAGRTS